MTSKNLPDFVHRIQTYQELEQFGQAFANGHLNLLLLFGTAGIGKSQHLHRAVGAQGCFIEGHASPFGIYLAAYEHRGKPLILDDVDGLYRDRNGVRLLKALAQTDQVKTVSWNTDAAGLERRGVPRKFDTTSRVAIVGNDWKTLNSDVAALEDRGHVVHFDPCALEVHLQASSWFWEQEVFDFVADHLHLIGRPSLRIYVRSAELRDAGMNWKEIVLSQCLSGKALDVAKLKADPRFSSDAEREREFVRRGLGSRATYYLYAKKMAPPTEVPRILLNNPRPPREVVPEVMPILDILRRRHRGLGNG
jgi:hypothetical protein